MESMTLQHPSFSNLPRASVPVLALAFALGAVHDLEAQAAEPRFRFHNAPGYYELGFDPVRDKWLGDACDALDIDNDGDRDLVLVRSNRLEFARNEKGDLQPLRAYDPTLTGPTGFDYLVSDAGVGDFDGDGFQDIVVTGGGQRVPWPGMTQLLLNDRAGDFVPQPTRLLPSTSDSHSRVEVAGDLDGDGRADFATYGFKQAKPLEVHFGNGTTMSYPSSLRIVEVRFANLGGDRKPDAVLLLEAVGTSDWYIQLRINDGAGGLANTSPSIHLPRSSTWHHIMGLEVGDYDQDGDIDVLTTDGASAPDHPQYTDVLILPGNRRGDLGAPIRSRVTDGHFWYLTHAEAGFLDRDGTLDLVLCSEYSLHGSSTGIVATLRGLGGGRFEFASVTSTRLRDFALVDFTGSGQPKVITSGGSVVPIDGDGRVGGTSVGSVLGSTTMTLFDLADFDGDKRVDVIVHDSRSGDVSVYFSDGERGFSDPLVLGLGIYLPKFLDAVDLNGDGRPDISLVISGARSGIDEVVTMLNLGGVGASQPFTTQVTPCASYVSPAGRAYGDLDGDGRVDFITSQKYETEGNYGRSLGDGTFATRCISFPAYLRALELADVTGDGELDIVFPAVPSVWGRPTDLWVMPGLGDGNFQRGYAMELGPLADQITTGDIDADGDIDVVTSRANSGLMVLHNDGSGRFVVAQELTREAGHLYTRLRLADFDGDGRPDLAARQGNSWSSVDLFSNQGGTFVRTFPAIDVLAHGSLAFEGEMRVADLDGDQLPDLCLGGVFPDQVANPVVYFNHTQLSTDGVLSPGETLEFTLREPRAAGRPYFLIGSSLGTQPGTHIGSALIPLNYDSYLWRAFRNFPSVFAGFSGRLDAQGRGHAELHVPPMVLTVPVPLSFAFIALDAAGAGTPHTSNKVSLTLR